MVKGAIKRKFKDHKMKYFNTTKSIRMAILVLFDVVSIAIAEFLALMMRFDFNTVTLTTHFAVNLVKYMPFAALVTVAVFAVMHLYQSL